MSKRSGLRLTAPGPDVTFIPYGAVKYCKRMNCIGILLCSRCDYIAQDCEIGKVESFICNDSRMVHALYRIELPERVKRVNILEKPIRSLGTSTLPRSLYTVSGTKLYILGVSPWSINITYVPYTFGDHIRAKYRHKARGKEGS